MPANLKEFIAGGFKLAYYTLLDTSGFATGFSGSVTAGATSSPAGRIKGAQVAPIQLPEAPVSNVLGDNVPIGAFLFVSEEVPNFQMQVAVRSLTNEAKFQGTKVQDIGNFSMGVLQPESVTPVDMAVWFIRDIKSRETSTVGKSAYETLLCPKVQAIPLGANFTQREVASFTYQVIVNPSAATPMGNTLTLAANGAEIAPALIYTSDYPVFLDSFLGNGALQTFNLTFTPASSSLSDVLVYVEGVRLPAGVTVSTVAKTITFSSAPDNNARIEVWYQYTI